MFSTTCASGMGHVRSKGQRCGPKLAYSTTCILDPHSIETHAITVASPLGIGVRTLPPFARVTYADFFIPGIWYTKKSGQKLGVHVIPLFGCRDGATTPTQA